MLRLASYLVLSAVSAVILLTGCMGDVPRNNPLDPQSPLFRNEGQLTGRVTTFYPPFQPLKSVRIEVQPGLWGALTDEQGQFAMPPLPAGDYLIRAGREGYAADSAQVTVTPGRAVSVEFNLDALPVFRTTAVRSAHIRRWWPLDDLYMILYEAEVSDPDGLADVQQVTVATASATIPLADTLVAGSRAGLFARSRTARELPTRSVHDLLGQPFIFVATDQPGNAGHSDPVFLVRVIDQVPDGLTSPDTLLLGQNVPLSWNATPVQFGVTYRVEVVRGEFGVPPTLVWSATDLTETQAVITDPLPAGTYFWTVAVVDSFGNWSRSREAQFIVISQSQ
jgi:hypothetical protein